MPIVKERELAGKLERFYKKNADIFDKPLKKIIKHMLEQCTYTNGESLERHNFGENPIQLTKIPKDINSHNFERELLQALECDENQKSIIELLWGDIQLGKRIQACIIMWISVHILKRPVLYIFRNLKIDQNQLADDIRDCNYDHDFQIKYIRKYFDEFMSEDIEEEDWKKFKLPELKDLGKNGEENENLKKLSSKNSINPDDIFCCLMNHKQLDKINTKLNEYICNNQELLNITLLVDESDLYAPTSSNNNENKNDLKDSTRCEQLLAKIYKKVRYVLHITGTAHSLFYNVTTKLTDYDSIQIPISTVHKMKRSEDYHGLFNNKINFETDSINEWWSDIDPETNKKKTYTLQEDYNININTIITNILNRPQNKYHSFLISEEKIRVNHLWLAHKIIYDFSQPFVIVFHGNCLRLYLPKKYEHSLKQCSKKDSEISKSKRLYDVDGIYGTSLDEHKSKKLPNNYCYYNISPKKYNLKQIYKLLAMLFKEEELDFRTVITITGKYGERGYSFTSDNYDKYQFHLTDQYFPCHVNNKNCTDISQRLRLQGKYTDNPTLTLWTSYELKDIIVNFFVPFMKVIETNIMDCNDWNEIKDLIECIISEQGNINFKYMKYIDARKKNKNWEQHKRYEKKHKGFRLIKIDNWTDEEIQHWINEEKKANKDLLEYKCVNTIKDDLTKDEFIEKYGIHKYEEKFIKIHNSEEITVITINKYIDKISEECGNKKEIKHINSEWLRHRTINKVNSCFRENIRSKFKILNKVECESNNDPGKYGGLTDSRKFFCYDNNVLYLGISLKTGGKILPGISTDIQKTPYHEDENGNIKYTILKKQYTKSEYQKDGDNFIDDTLPEKYYWKTPDGWLFLYDNKKGKNDIISIDIIEPKTKAIVISKEQIINQKDINIKDFVDQCFKTTEQPNLRIGINDIMKEYKNWCKKNKLYTQKTRTEVKKLLKILGYEEVKSKGIDLNSKPGKRGFNIELNII
jgi:hypothetical protein